MLKIFFICLSCLFIATPSLAQNTSDPAQETTPIESTETRLASLFTTIIEEQKTLTALDGSELQTKGEVSVENAGSYYAITLPHITIAHPDGGSLEIGIIAINAREHDVKGQWKMSVSIPTPLRLAHGMEVQGTTIAIGAQKANGIFHEAYRQFSKFNARYDDITILRANQKATIERLSFTTDFAQTPQNRWSGPSFATIRNIRIGSDSATQNNKSALKIASIKADIALDEYNPAAGKRHKENILELHKSGALKNINTLSKSTREAIAASSLELFTKGMNGFDGIYKITGIEATNRKGEKAAIDTMQIKMGANGFLSGNLMDFALSIDYDGLDIASIAAEEKDIIPAKAKLGFAIRNIPFRDLAKLGQTTLAAKKNDENAMQALQMSGLALMLKLPAILSQAGTTVEIKDNGLGNALYNLAINGEIRADIMAKNNATAQASAIFTGLTPLMKKLKTVSEPTKYTAIIGRLEQFLNLAVKDGDLHRIDFAMGEDGKMLLNGQNAREP